MTLQEYTKYALAKKQIEYHSYDPRAIFQCVDLANDYIAKVWGLETILGTNAKDFPENIKIGMKFIKNTVDYLPEPGEIVVWNGKVGGGAGHIAIVTKKGLQTVFYSLDQNWGIPLFITEEKHNYTNVRGFIRKVVQEPMPDNALQECLKQHTQLVTELEAEKKKTQGLEEQVKLKDEESQRLRGEIAEKASALKTVREDLAQFLDTLAGKLTTLVDKSEVIASVDRLLSGESEQLKKIKNLEKAYALLESEKKLEIEQLKKSIDSLRTVNETQSDHITTLEKRIEAIESNDTPTQDNKAYFEAFEKVVQAIKKLFERKV
jgi:hypothetical protein